MLVFLEIFLSKFTCFSEKVSVLLLYLLHADTLPPFSDNEWYQWGFCQQTSHDSFLDWFNRNSWIDACNVHSVPKMNLVNNIIVSKRMSPWGICPASIFSGDFSESDHLLVRKHKAVVGQHHTVGAAGTCTGSVVWPGPSLPGQCGCTPDTGRRPHTSLESVRTSCSSWHGWWKVDRCLPDSVSHIQHAEWTYLNLMF